MIREFLRSLVAPEPDFAPCTPQLLIAVSKALRRVQETGQTGDYLEFGVYRGFTLWYAQALAKDLGLGGLRFFGFDSFAGLPEAVGVDAQRPEEAFQPGAFSASRAYVEKKLTGMKADLSRIKLIEGFFDRSLTAAVRKENGLERCAICVIDCDLYESTKSALAFVEPLIGDGTIILFDDWFSYGGDPAAGEQRAFTELLARRADLKAEPFVDIHDHGKGFVLRVISK